MKTYAEIKAELQRLEALGLQTGDWVWLKQATERPRQMAQLRGPLEAVVLIKITPVDATDDGLRVMTADQIEGRVVS